MLSDRKTSTTLAPSATFGNLKTDMNTFIKPSFVSVEKEPMNEVSETRGKPG